jgi:hypothetical protein
MYYMKRFFFLTLTFFYLNSSGFAQTTVAVDKPQRLIRFIDLDSYMNKPFFRRNQEISKLVMDAIEIGDIHPYYIDYKNKAVEKVLDKADFRKKISFETTFDFNGVETAYTVLLYPRDFYTLGLDQTIGEIQGKEYAQVHYVNFYANGDSKEKPIKYRFSIKWDDFLSVLNKHTDILYYTNSFNSWWRGEVFITSSNYIIDEALCGKFIELSFALPEFKAEDYRKRGSLYDLNEYKKEPYLKGGYLLDLYLIEQKKGNQYNVSTLVIEDMQDTEGYGNGKRFAFDWKAFLKIAQDSSWRNRSEVFTLMEAFKLQKFMYSNSSKNIEISRNGQFVNGGQDKLCRDQISNSFYVDSPRNFEKFYTDYLEGVFLNDPLNVHLHRPGHSIVELSIEYFLKGKIMAFEDETFQEHLAREAFIAGASEVIDARRFDTSQKYHKGDTLRTEEWKYYILLQDIEPFTCTRIDSNKISLPFTPARYEPQRLIPLQLVQKLTFDKEGNGKNYQVQGIGLFVPYDINIKGVEIPIGFFKWEELRKQLLSDPRAMVVYKGKKVNLVELVENRTFYSLFYKTGTLHPMDK